MFAIRLIIFSIIISIPLSLMATSPIRSWSTDMYNQPSIKSFEEGSMTSFPVGSVTTEGLVIRSDGVDNEYAKNLPWNDFAEDGFKYNPKLTPTNPRAKSAASIENGDYLYQVNCAACHGINGDANTTIGRLRAVPAFNENIPLFSEGYIYMRVTYGGSILTSMPPHEYILSNSERWDVVNYVKTTFKKLIL